MTDEQIVRWYECERKERFSDFALADDHALASMRNNPVRPDGSNTNLFAYECEWCRGFHFGKRRANPRGWQHRLRQAKYNLSLSA